METIIQATAASLDRTSEKECLHYSELLKDYKNLLFHSNEKEVKREVKREKLTEKKAKNQYDGFSKVFKKTTKAETEAPIKIKAVSTGTLSKDVSINNMDLKDVFDKYSEK